MNRGSEILDAGKQRNHVTFPESLFFGIWKSLPFKMPSWESLPLIPGYPFFQFFEPVRDNDDFLWRFDC
jgi:hypothetical protein